MVVDARRAPRSRAFGCVWRHVRAPLQGNVLTRLPEPDMAAMFAVPSGPRVIELFRG